MNEIEYYRMRDIEGGHWWYRGLHSEVIGHVKPEAALKGALEMFDAGCGAGGLMCLLGDFGKVRGCDGSPLAVSMCRERGLDVYEADLNSAELEHERYDLITFMDVLYHRSIVDERRVLRALWRGLKPGGLLLLNLPAFEFLRSSHDDAVHTGRRYRRAEVVGLLSGAGFRVERCHYRLWLLFPMVAVHRLTRRWRDRSLAPQERTSDVYSLPAVLNSVLTKLIMLENRLHPFIPAPFGLSVFAVARKPATQSEPSAG